MNTGISFGLLKFIKRLGQTIGDLIEKVQDSNFTEEEVKNGNPGTVH